MPLAKEVAAELRKLAESLEQSPDTKVPHASVYFRCSTKVEFTDTVRSLPRPLKKKISDPGQSWASLRVKHETPTVEIDCSIPQSLSCILVEPAKPAVYSCPPILSENEAEDIIL